MQKNTLNVLYIFTYWDCTEISQTKFRVTENDAF